MSILIDASAVVHRLFLLGLDTVEIATALGVTEPLVIDALEAHAAKQHDDPPRQEACP
jgi:hypothetical protein